MNNLSEEELEFIRKTKEKVENQTGQKKKKNICLIQIKTLLK